MNRNKKLITLFLVALASLILGMGVPVTAAYLITAVLVVPAFGDLGVAAIAAHMIVYWLSQDSNITPPVCVAAFAGAAIAKADPWKTGWTAFKYAKMLYVMPIMFAFVPATLLEGETTEILMVFVGVALGTIGFAASIQGYLRDHLGAFPRVVVVCSTILLFWPSWIGTLVGIMGMFLVWNDFFRRKVS